MSTYKVQSSPLTAYLHWKYRDFPVYSRNDIKLPLAVYPILPDHNFDSLLPDSLLASLDQTYPTEQLIGDPHYHQQLLDAGKPIVNLPTYCLRRLDAASKPQLHCELGMYFNMLDTCDALTEEIQHNKHLLHGIEEKDFLEFDRHLPLRNRLHAAVKNPILDGSHRSVALAVSVTIAFQHENSHAILMQKRSAQVAVGAGMLHVTPSFMFQPITENAMDDFSIADQIYREYLEELFNRPEVHGREWRHMLQDPEAVYLRQLIERKEAELLTTGIVVNLFNLRPEITMLLFIHTPEWGRRHIQGDSEHALHMNEESASSHPVMIPFMKDDDDAALMQRGFSPDALAPMASGAIWMGVDYMRKKLR